MLFFILLIFVFVTIWYLFYNKTGILGSVLGYYQNIGHLLDR